MARILTAGIPEGFVDQFDNTLYHLLGQSESKFQQAVDIKPITNAEDKAFDAIGKLALTEKTERNPQTPTQEITTERRWVNTTPFHQAVLIDKDDDLNRVVEPTSDIMMEFVRAVNLKKDDIILAAIDGDVVSVIAENADSEVVLADVIENVLIPEVREVKVLEEEWITSDMCKTTLILI